MNVLSEKDGLSVLMNFADPASSEVRLDSIEHLVVGGIPTARLTRSELASLMRRHVFDNKDGKAALPKLIFASNGSVIARFHGNAEFRKVLLEADIIDADGMPLVIASKVFCKKPLIERVATTDFIEDAAVVAAKSGIRFYLLGAEPGTAESAAAKLMDTYEGLRIVGTQHGYFTHSEEAAICDEIVKAGTDILWVGMGSPLQEEFAVRNRERLRGVTWIRTCGGLFDHCTGKTKRAPKWMRDFGLEWFSRMMQEPERLGLRYLISNPVAIFYLATQTFD